MEFIADILLAAGALGAGLYCFVLARRLKRFNDLEKGVGGAVAVLSSQVDDLCKTLSSAQTMSEGSNAALNDLTQRAESVAGRLELMMASFHDVPAPEPVSQPAPPAPAEELAAETPAPRANGPMFMRHERHAEKAAE